MKLSSHIKNLVMAQTIRALYGTEVLRQMVSRY